MKKIISFICLLILPMLFIACGNIDNSKDSNDEKKVEDTSEEDSSLPKSHDLYSFEIMLNGKSYTLPEDFSEFKANGWIIKDGNDDVIAPNEHVSGKFIKCEDSKIEATFINNGKDELPADECEVGGIYVDKLATKKGTVLVLPKGIGFDSTKDDVIMAYGNPTNINDSQTRCVLYYEIKANQNASISIDKESGKVESIYINNFIDKKDASDKKNDDSSTEVPDSVEQYKAPSELTDDISSFNVNYDGVLYHLPIPVSELVKNGWIIQESPKENIPARNSISGVVLRKGNQVITTTIYNDSPKAASVENCFLTEIREDELVNKIPVVLPKGIRIGSSKAEVESAFSGLNITKHEDSYVETYSYSPNNSYNQSIEITVKKETGVVSKILMQYALEKSK